MDPEALLVLVASQQSPFGRLAIYQRLGQGHLATVLLVVQREDVMHGVRPSAWHDPTFAAAAKRAHAAGVRFRAVRASVAIDGTRITHEIPVDLDGALDEAVVEAVGGWCEQNKETTGWTRSQSGARVANGPFAHNKKKETKKEATTPKKRRASAADEARTTTPKKGRKADGTGSGSSSKYF